MLRISQYWPEFLAPCKKVRFTDPPPVFIVPFVHEFIVHGNSGIATLYNLSPWVFLRRYPDHEAE